MTCEKCSHAFRDGPVLKCRRYPPTAVAVVVPTPPTPANPHGGVGLQALAMHPQVQPDGVCGEYKVRLGVVN